MSGVPAVPRGGRVAVVGAVNADFVVAADRLPAPGETVVGAGVRRHGGGKGANAAVAAARAGATVRLVGAVGTDPVAEQAESELREDGVDCEGLVRLVDSPTGVALIVVDPAGENQIAVGAGANLALDAGWVRERLERWAGDLDCVLISTEIPDQTAAAAVAAAAAAGLTCVLNPAPPVAAVVGALAHRPLLTPNRGELVTLLELIVASGDPGRVAAADLEAVAASGDAERQARTLAGLTGAPVVVTLGAEGVLLVDGERAEHVAAPPADVRDATGAGDTFNGVLAAQLAAGEPLTAAVRWATVAASLSVTAVGARTGMPTADAIAAARAAARTP